MGSPRELPKGELSPPNHMLLCERLRHIGHAGYSGIGHLANMHGRWLPSDRS